MTDAPRQSEAREPCELGGLEAIFRPASVAVIGAGRDPTSISGRLFRNLLTSFQGPVYPVNPAATEIAGVPCFARVNDIPRPVELAFIAVPARGVPLAVQQCLDKGVRGLVLISAGYSETGEEGKRSEQRLLELVREAGLRMVGPNCFGVFNTDPSVRLEGTFAESTPPEGDIGIGSQSGALGVVIPDCLRERRLGASTFASVGNKADVSENDLLRYWIDDPATRVALLYLESFQDPREFRRLATELTRCKPLIVLKAAHTEVGARAAASHTAAVTSSDLAADGLLVQCGAVRVSTLKELFDTASLCSMQPLPAGRRVAIITNAGGPGILCADALAARRLVLPRFSTRLQQELRSFLPTHASVQNPIDLVASIDAGEFRHCLELVMASDEADALITIYVPREQGTSAAVARAIRESSRGRAKTSLAVFMQPGGQPAELSGDGLRVPAFSYPEDAASALAHAVECAERRRRPAGVTPQLHGVNVAACRAIVAEARRLAKASSLWLDAPTVDRLLTSLGFSTPRGVLARTVDEAIAAGDRWRSPVVLKVVSPGVTHKSDVGGVVLNVQGESQIQTAFEQVQRAALDSQGVWVQEYRPDGVEMLLGVIRDAQFGPLVTLGLGGTFVELFRDVTCRLHPLTDRDAAEMVAGLRASRLLAGYRRTPAADLAALEDALLRASALVSIVPEIEELDLNPLMALATGAGVRVLDARIRIAT